MSSGMSLPRAFLAAFITPTPDAVNQSIVAGTLIVLYEISIWLAKLAQKRRKPPEDGEQVLAKP